MATTVSGRTYALPGVRPWVRNAANEIGGRFNVATIYGVSPGSVVGSFHPLGRALDLMVYTDRAKGDSIAAYAIANSGRLGIIEIIWYRRIWTPGRGWQPYSHPAGGGATLEHRDHVHLSFSGSAPTGASTPIDTPQGFGNPLSGVGAGLEKLQNIVSFVVDPHNWLRLGMLVSGVVLLIVGLFTIDKVKTAAKGVRRAVA